MRTLIQVALIALPVLAFAADEATLEQYYQLDQTKHLRLALHDIIDDHTVITYTNTWEPLRVLDADPNVTGNVMLVYSLRSEFGTVPDPETKLQWNREHLWPNSYGLDSIHPSYSDLHNLRPADTEVNSSRGNKPYDISDRNSPSFRTPGFSEAPGTTADSDSWEPPVEVRGDVARAAFYMATRYIGDKENEPNLVLTNDLTKVSSDNTFFGKLSILLQWHEDDPPDDAERQRNDLIFDNYQGNRNPFIDRPEYAQMVFADIPDEDGDGLTTFDEVFIYRTDPNNADSNNDGLSDGLMVSKGFDPWRDYKPLMDSIVEDTHFRNGGILVEKVGDQYQIKLTIEKSEDLKTWTVYQEQTILIDAGSGKNFLRVKME
jgi:endonuclease I